MKAYYLYFLRDFIKVAPRKSFTKLKLSGVHV